MTAEQVQDADRAIERAIKQRIVAGNTDIIDVLRRLANYVPDAPAKSIIRPEMLALYGEPDHDCPFFTEMYLYALLGKEDARTVLAYIGAIARAVGLDGIHDLRRE